MLRNILSGVAVVAFAASVSAQSQLPVHQAVQPKFAGVYKVAAGEFVPATQDRSGPVVLFNNTTATNYYSVPGANQEWIDEGCLADRNVCDTDQINGFEIIYCSSDPSPTGSIGITFYDETIICSGPPTWPTANCAYAISGLPMGTPTGGLQCWIVTVDLEGGFECPNNKADSFRTTGAAGMLFGWGFIPALPNTGPWIRTGGTCPDNSFTWHDRNTTSFVGCFWFGGVPFASFSMKMFGNMANSQEFYANPALAKDTLVVENTTNVLAGGAPDTWAVTNPTAGQDYWLVASRFSDYVAVGGAGGFTLQLDITPTLPPTPVKMPGAGILTYGGAYPAGNVYVQVFCVDAGDPLTPGNINAASNLLCHCF